jgi:hypothetical protein
VPNDNNPPGREALGRSRGGLTTKIHLAADRRCRPVTRILTPGQHGDCPQFIPLFNQVRIARIDAVERGRQPGDRPGMEVLSVEAQSASCGLHRHGATSAERVRDHRART